MIPKWYFDLLFPFFTVFHQDLTTPTLILLFFFLVLLCPKLFFMLFKLFYINELNSLKSFVLPGGHELSSRLHIARTVCRRCERVVVELSKKEKINKLILSYLNRLSDMLFVSSRWVNHLLDVKEVTWNPNYGK